MRSVMRLWLSWGSQASALAVVACPLITPGVGAAVDADIDEGLGLLRSGQAEQALVKLAVVAQRYQEAGLPKKEARARLYLGAAEAALGQEELAFAEFCQAVGLDPSLTLDPREFPKRTRRILESAWKSIYANPPSLRVPRLIGAAGLLGAGALALTKPTPVVQSNAPPVITRFALESSPESASGLLPVALTGLTRVAFCALAHDPDTTQSESGPTLDAQVDFGDGTTGTLAFSQYWHGDAAGYRTNWEPAWEGDHVFAKEGDLRAVLTVRDSHGATTTASIQLRSRSLTGTWAECGGASVYRLVQAGAQATGTCDPCPPGVSAPIEMALTDRPFRAGGEGTAIVSSWRQAGHSGSGRIDASLGILQLSGSLGLTLCRQ